MPVIDQPVSCAIDRSKTGNENMPPIATQPNRPPAATITQRYPKLSIKPLPNGPVWDEDEPEIGEPTAPKEKISTVVVCQRQHFTDLRTVEVLPGLISF
jgi:hypothetical protein